MDDSVEEEEAMEKLEGHQNFEYVFTKLVNLSELLNQNGENETIRPNIN